MSIISRPYFKGDLALANITEMTPNDSSGNGLLLDHFIQKCEREILIKTLGFDLFREFKTQFDIDATNGNWTLKDASIGTKWDELLNGLEYEVDGKFVEWRGLIFTDSDIAESEPDRSFIANYVYCCFLEKNEFQHTGLGFQRDQAKNSVPVSGRSMWATSWNDMVKIIWSMYSFISDMNAIDSTAFPNWDGECFEYKNRFGL